MSAIIGSQQAVSGGSFYAVVRDILGNPANGTSTEAYNSANWANYVNNMTEQTGSGFFKVNFPSYLANGFYTYSVHSGSGTLGDVSVDRGEIDWNGSTENYLGLITSKLPAGAISSFDPSSQTVNLGNNQTGVTIGTVNALGTSAAASVKTQIDTAIGSDAIPELSGVPSATPTLKTALQFLFQALRNKRTSDATTVKVYNASGAVIATATQSDNGTIYDKENFT